MKRDNHYVPDSYLKRWSNADGKVSTYRLLVQHKNARQWKTYSPKSIGFHQHLYTQITAGGESDAFEDWIAREYEDPAAKPIQRVVNGLELNKEEWKILIRYLAAQDVRTPAHLMERMQQWTKTIPPILNDSLRRSVKIPKNSRHSGKSIRLLLDENLSDSFPLRTTIERNDKEKTAHISVDTIIGRQLWLWSIKHALTSTLNILYKHHWTILTSPPGIEWLTSDNPVVRLNYYGNENYDLKGGWGQKNGVIFMPISPTQLMFTQVGYSQKISSETSLMFSAKIQRYIIENAHRYVFSRRIDPQVVMWRPRQVNSATFHAEAEYWRKWHENQSNAEIELMTK